MNVKTDLFFKGDFVTSYLGRNKRILNSKFKLFSQPITLHQTLKINGGEIPRLCFEVNFLNRKFLLVLDCEKIYEILELEGEKIYVLLTESWMYVINHFVDGENYITQGTFNLHYVYNKQAEFIEEFTYELILPNDVNIKMLFQSLRSSNEDNLIIN